MTWDEEVDVLVVGSGAAGMTAALAAAARGMNVTICEKTDWVGGTSATSAGTLWVPGVPPWSTEAGDSREAVERYLRTEIGSDARSDLLDAFLESGPEAIAFLNSEGAGLVPARGNPDYHADMPGGAEAGRAWTPEPFDGRELGGDFGLLRPPHAVLTIFGGMMIGRRELPDLLRPFASPAAAWRVARLLLRHGRDRIRYPRGTRLLLGNALMARLLLAVRGRGIGLRTRTALAGLVVDPSGRVTGAELYAAGRPLRILARRGVVLATGGFPGDTARVAAAAGLPTEGLRCYAFPESRGEALDAALRLGARLDIPALGPALWTPVSVHRDRRGHEVIWAHHSLDRGKPGCIAVDGHGRRFVNEADSYHDFVLGMLRAGGRAHLICDRAFLRRYGLGLIRPLWQRPERWVREGYVRRDGTLAGLAGQIGVDPAVLQATVERANAHARAGMDPDFARGTRVLNRLNGDPTRPHPSLGEIKHPPFFALPLVPGVLATAAGLATDADAAVLGPAGPISGLYAVGADMASPFRGAYPGPGISLGAAATFAWRAARALAGGPSKG